MSQFYNPYQFVPVTGTIDGERSGRADYADVAEGASRDHASARHDHWHRDAVSGRIVCSLYLDTPLVVGNAHTPDPHGGATYVHQYCWRGSEAIPGNSLKGMISSVAEALSQSALRVLSDAPITLRVTDDTRPHGTRRDRLALTPRDYFRHIDPDNPDLVPWSKHRATLTPAELLFGVVEVNEKGANPDQGRNFAGRLRFQDALPARPAIRRLPATMLKILDSPKLVNGCCVPFYLHFRDNRGGWMSKDQVYQNQGNRDILPNGRKFYLHHPQAQIDEQAWATARPGARPDLKVRCAPIAAGQTFVFHVDFENLWPAELTLLERALAPGPGFRHRLGLGKSLGLGSVTLCIEGVFRLDPLQRYSAAALDDPERRYAECWRPDHTPLRPERKSNFGLTHPREWEALNADGLTMKPQEYADTSLIDSETLEILCTLGDPAFLVGGTRVHTPLTPDQLAAQEEDRTFKWFNQNDRRAAQTLRPVKPRGTLPPLYSTPQEALQAGICFVPDVGAVAQGDSESAGDPEVSAWLEERLPGLYKETGAKDEDAVLRAAPAAKVVVQIDDLDLRARLFTALKLRWSESGIWPTDKVRKIYERAGLHFDEGSEG